MATDSAFDNTLALLETLSQKVKNGLPDGELCNWVIAECGKSPTLKKQIDALALAAYQSEIKKNYLTPHLELLRDLNTIARDYLVATHVMACLSERAPQNADTFEPLSHVYPQRVNRFCKAILQRIPDAKRVVDTLFIAFEQKSNHRRQTDKQKHDRVKAHVCYLLGRIQNDQQKTRAIQAMRRWRDRLGNVREPHRVTEKGNYQISKVFASLDAPGDRLLFRTISISLVLLGQADEATTYVRACLRNKHFDSLNRGFHLEYYGDIAYDPREPMNHIDSLCDCSSTFDRLYEKLETSYARNQPYGLRDIELQTLLSLAQHRHAAGKLHDSHRNFLLSFLNKHSDVNLTNIPILRSYCALLREHLNQPNFQRAMLLAELYKLKKKPRRGWNDAFNNRMTPNPESILSHTGGGLLLIQFCLPETLSPEDRQWLGAEAAKEYSKEKILTMFLVHDLAEAYMDDLLPRERTDEAKENEDRLTSMIDLFATYAGFEQFGLYRLWRGFENNLNVNARVAREIDALENLLQLLIENRSEGVSIPDYKPWREGLIKRINTPMGKRVLDIILGLK
jgi:hypothetical protein